MSWTPTNFKIDWCRGTRSVRGYAIDSIFAVHRDSYSSRWTLTHLPTGYSAGQLYRRREDARLCALALTKKFGLSRWSFVNPKHAKKLKGAYEIIRKHHGYLF